MKIIELELLSDNIAETETFYRKTLGLEPYIKEETVIIFHVGATRLIFRKSDKLRPVYHFAIDVPNNRFEEAHQYIKSKTPLLPVEKGSEIADFKNWDAKSFYFYDNNGNIVEFITRYANKTFSDSPFNGNSYINVSEIGLVTNNVPELADRLEKEFGIPVFHRQPRGKRFTVSGDDDGLFILAEKGRDWYPTKIKSQSFRIRVLFINEDAVHQFIR